MGLPPFFCVTGFLSGPVAGLLVGLMIFVKLVFYVKILFCSPCILRSWIFSRPGTGLLVWLMILVKWAFLTRASNLVVVCGCKFGVLQ